MPEFNINKTPSPFKRDVWRDLSALERGFVEAVFFTADTSYNAVPGEDAGEDLTEANVNDLSDCSLVKIKEICALFQTSAAYQEYIYDDEVEDSDAATIGRELLYTSQGHGCGFWDGSYPARHGNALTQAAEVSCGEIYLYRGDDGLLYLV